ncbi:hypothetical protein ACC754_38120, partial [Rhizobium johnstonii]
SSAAAADTPSRSIIVTCDLRAKADDPYRGAFLTEIQAITASEPLSNVLGKVADSPWPVPVVCDRNRYIGSISKSALIETLDRAS